MFDRNNNYFTDYEEVSASSYNPTKVQSAFSALMRKVYTWMALALTVTGLTALYVAGNEQLAVSVTTGGTLWVLLIAELALVFILSGAINKLSFMTAGLMFIAYSVLNGITMSFIFLIYTKASIASTFFITAGTFAAMSVVGYVTKRDLSGMGKILFMALIGLIIASIVNIFLKSTPIYWLLSIVGVLIFVGLTAWDTQKIKQMFLAYGNDVNPETQKLALLGSLTLYLDFINLFLYLLRLLGDRK
ncbi:MAG: Bax inhibitor-1/YccA family protein [Bacteroidaceae bacterium]|nr:Bax inhibitor-1/YccA family protein [Bacteroidaceae bacterium]